MGIGQPLVGTEKRTPKRSQFTPANLIGLRGFGGTGERCYDPYRCEELLADCLRDVYGACEILKLGGRKDEGVDIKAVGSDGQTNSMELFTLADVVELLGEPITPSPVPWERCGIRLNVTEPEWDVEEDWIERTALPPGLSGSY